MGKKKQNISFTWAAIWGGIVLIIINVCCPWAIPISSTSLWTMKGTVSEWFTAATPFFVWAATVNVIFGLTTRITSREEQEHDTVAMLLGSLMISAFAGFFEEILFRWLLFFPTIATLRLMNYCIFGFLGFGFAENFHNYVWGPVADYTTLHYLSPWIYDTDTWAVGAAMLYANAAFRDGHKYQGLLGFVNSWFIGMFFFYLALNYGLPAAILVHFTYDVVCFGTATLVRTFRVATGIGPRQRASADELRALERQINLHFQQKR